MKLKLLLSLCLFCVNLWAQESRIILRDGKELEVEILQIEVDAITFKTSPHKNASAETLPLRNVYMLQTPENDVFFTPAGKHIVRDKLRIGEDAAIIYHERGWGIEAYNVKINGVAAITYDRINQEGDLEPHYISPTVVFMIKYPDGTKRLINRTNRGRTIPDGVSRTKAKKTMEKQRTKNEEVQMQVIFHNVRSGETLSTIAERYDVDIKDIIAWNNLPIKIRTDVRLQTDMQLMIYVKPIN